ncbi:MAG: hypothetical protein AB1758_23975, partial [Candidatus Eremiobacterota bacterium]
DFEGLLQDVSREAELARQNNTRYDRNVGFATKVSEWSLKKMEQNPDYPGARPLHDSSVNFLGVYGESLLPKR